MGAGSASIAAGSAADGPASASAVGDGDFSSFSFGGEDAIVTSRPM